MTSSRLHPLRLLAETPSAFALAEVVPPKENSSWVLQSSVSSTSLEETEVETEGSCWTAFSSCVSLTSATVVVLCRGENFCNFAVLLTTSLLWTDRSCCSFACIDALLPFSQAFFTRHVTKLWLLRLHLIQIWLPFLHLPSLVSSAHPLLMLKAQQIGFPLSSNWWYPFSSSGQFAFAFAEAFAFFLGFPSLGGPPGVFLAPSSTEPLAVDREVLVGNGKRCMLILGSCASCPINMSKGSSPLGPLTKGPLCSCAMRVNSSRSARRTCSICTFEYPGGASLVSCINSDCTHLSWTSFEINLHWSNAKPRRCRAHCIKSSFEVSALIFGSPADNFNVCCSTVKVVGFSLSDCCTSASLFVHLLGGIQTIDPLSKIPATKSISAYDGWSSPLIDSPLNLACWSLRRATFSTGGSLRPPSTPASVETFVFKWATTIVTASKWSRRNKDNMVMDGSMPPFLCCKLSERFFTGWCLRRPNCKCQPHETGKVCGRA